MDTYIIENDTVYHVTDKVKAAIGASTYTQTNRIDDSTVEDVTMTFDLTQQKYVSGASTTRTDYLYSLDEVKAQQKSALQASHDAELYTSFTSSALGTVRTYSYSQAASTRLEAWLTVIAANTAIASVDWYTAEDGKAMTHTRSQFIQVCMDGATRAQGIEMKLIQLFSNVDAVQTSSTVTLTQAIQQIKSITW